MAEVAQRRVRTVTLEAADDVASFRAAMRSLLQQGVEPQQVHWCVAESAERDLFEEAGEPAATAPASTAQVSVDSSIRLPAFFVPLRIGFSNALFPSPGTPNTAEHGAQCA